MSSNRCTTVLTCLAIVILVALLVTVWVLLNQGAFKPKQQRSDKKMIVYQPTRHKEYIDKSHLDDFGYNGDMEFVKPLKISPLPLHDHDIIFDRMRNYHHDKTLIKHHSGHFRHKQAEVWDPHPRYEIDAFGHKLLLELEQDDQFLGPNLQITHVWENYTERVGHDRRTSGCFYTGKIKGDINSDVAVSLCNGMTGYIRSSEGNYYIEPAERPTTDPLGSFLHRIKKIPHQPLSVTNNDVVNSESDQCETNEEQQHTIIEDDFGGEVVEIPPSSHLISKRQVQYFDDINTDDETNTQWSAWLGDDDDDDFQDYPSKDQPYAQPSRTTRDTDSIIHHYDSVEDRKSNEYFMKVLVVADRTMVEYHQTDEDLHHYILTLMSHAALLYKDATIGNSLSLSVVNIWVLKDIDFTSSNSQVMLRRFCEWQQHYAFDRQHDTALLLTRDTICKNSTSHCNTLGVAEVSSMCDPSSSCSIVRDKGLSSSYTIAHELGHILSMPHDDDKKCFVFHKGREQNNIMSRMLQNGTKPWMWSECSKHFVTEFLGSNKAKCMIKPPSQNYITSKFAEILPGETFEVDRQCELEFGGGSKMCSFMPACGSLWCTTLIGEKGGCKTQYLPWAEGTTCGHRHWCHHGKCIPADRELLSPIAGGWGPWLGWSECSRTCGGGVQSSKRLCNSPTPENGGPYCTGRSIRYVSCNTHSCEKDVPDFREIQCAHFNGITKNLPNLTRDVQWVPKYGLDQPEDYCKLYCRPKSSNAYYLLKEKVVDGTKCGLNSFDICVNGICRPGGCDNNLESSIALDECGVCGGDNSKCEEITGNYTLSPSHGYNRVLRIPKGSSNLDIRQAQNSKNDENYLALVDGETGEYILNGNYVVSTHQKDVIFGAIIIKYSGSSASIERITTPKNHKLSKDLVLDVLSVGKSLSPDITYRYIINQDSAPKFGWRLYRKQWSKCNSVCGGTQYMHPTCVELATNKQQADSYCSQSEKKHQVQKRECNVHCQLIWNVVSRGACSANCGEGVRNVYYNCVKIDSIKENFELYSNTPGNSYREVVADKHCSVLQKPPSHETCHGQCDSTRWDYGDWSECSVTCGGGTQRRSAECVDSESRVIDQTHCANLEKITQQICNGQKCPVWASREWTPCSVTCGRGYRTKPYFCHLDGRILDPSACDSRQKRFEEEECNMKPCASWSTGVWGECSKTCGEGVQKRNVLCKNLDDNHVLEDDFCRDMLKPNDSKACTNAKVCEELTLPYRRYDYDNNEIGDNSIYDGTTKFKWITGAWSECSKSCNSGTRSRVVLCRNDFGKEIDYLCDQSLRPISTIECNAHACPTWKYGGWSGCDSRCEKHRQVSCQSFSGSYVDHVQCDNSTRPASSTQCKINECAGKPIPKDYFNSKENNDRPRYKWKVGKWKQCSNTCGKGLRKRHIECEDALNDVTLVDQYCSHLRRPKMAKPCERYSCSHTWVESYWSPCSATCGEGVRTKNVTCHKVYPGGIIDPLALPDFRSNRINPKNYCDIYNKPPSTGTCMQSHCSDQFVWRTGPWKQCSHACGRKGRQLRMLFCENVRSGQKVQKHHCPKSLKPPRKRKCNQWKCLHNNCKEIQRYGNSTTNKDYFIQIRGRPAEIYCYKMDTLEPEEFITLHGDGQNFAENYHKRLKDPHSCPYNGRRVDTCDCLGVGPDRSGMTMFWKVRLNVTSLRIIGDDFTFSRHSTKMRTAFGTAGDCYSAMEGCPQGRFSIDLSGTSFKLSNNVRWEKIGTSSTSHVDFSERQVRGKCGGYCGNCIPDPDIGLQVEIT